MTDAQIALYAALRVAVDPSWRISGRSTGEPDQPTQVVYFSRPQIPEFVDGIPRFDNFQVEELALMVSRPLLETPNFTALVISNVVREAKVATALPDWTRHVRKLASLLDGAARRR